MKRLAWLVCLVGCGADDDASPAPPCLADDFEDGSLDASQWEELQPTSPFAIDERDGKLVVTLRPNTTGINGLVSRRAHALTDGIVDVDRSLGPTGPRVRTGIELRDGATRLVMTMGSGLFVASAVFAGGSPDELTEMLGDHGRVRFRHDSAAGTIAFESYRYIDATWRTIHEVSAPEGDLMFEVRLYGEASDGGNQAPGSASFDEVRVTNGTCP